MAERILPQENAVLRHERIELLEHWLFALSGLILIFSGFGELPMYKRFLITELPLMSWSGDYYLHLKIHYLAAVIFVSVAVFHLVYHGLMGHRGLIPKKGDLGASGKTILSFAGIGREPKSGKYLPEQRLAYLYLALVAGILIATGLIKVVKNLPGIYLPPGLITVATLTHTIATVFFLLGVIAHLAALVLKVNRPLVRPIFTGKVDLDYVRLRHTLWYDELVALGQPDVIAGEDEPLEALAPLEGLEGGGGPAEEQPEGSKE